MTDNIFLNNARRPSLTTLGMLLLRQ